ncbi:SDR family oxidoreductase [Corynebacterium tapiri]|uniref:SDR family oxidoreductase n=1 Tax=Corynebacterium tapiri TaxID=1448266 RepID=A0A5C4U4G6_9CORY|nr:SDR family oxidoreductase [Corynebacterium tapiri]TNL97620.1 SDR family oxidoreductase [Corynebacterium tapiri]
MSILLLGATSDIGTQLLDLLAPGEDVVLAARNPEAIPEPKRARSSHRIAFEATDLASHRQVVEEAERLAGPITTAIVAFGILGDQTRAESDEAHAVEIATVDYTAQISMLTVLADTMISGRIIAFSSIAGWRARRANYVYGSTKAGLDAFCQGLADRLHGSELELYIARPGFVIGSMTEGMSPAPLSVRPRDVAEAIVDRLGKPGTIWIPRRLAVLAAVMRVVPRPIWRHMPR